MANWKKVDADQLDADLTSVADAIRERSGTSEQMNFPDGFVSAVEGIPDGSDVLSALIDRSITSIESDKITTIGSNAFINCKQLISVSLPNVTKGDGSMFANCNALVNINLPLLTTASANAFQGIGASVCDFPMLGYIHGSYFKNATNLATLILRRSTLCGLSSTNAFDGTPIASGNGYIYVPRALLSDTDASKDYRRASNWSNFSSQFRAIEDYPEITGG